MFTCLLVKRFAIYNIMSDLCGRLSSAGFKVTHNPVGNGECFYATAVFQLGLTVCSVKKEIFDYLKKNRFNVSTCSVIYSSWKIPALGYLRPLKDICVI